VAARPGSEAGTPLPHKNQALAWLSKAINERSGFVTASCCGLKQCEQLVSPISHESRE
jgi:hypothetical protein